jgi:hypothetical protein
LSAAVGLFAWWQRDGRRMESHGAGGSGPGWFGTVLMPPRRLMITGTGYSPMPVRCLNQRWLRGRLHYELAGLWRAAAAGYQAAIGPRDRYCGPSAMG